MAAESERRTMLPVSDSFEYEYRGCDLRYGRGRVAELHDYLAERDLERGLIVCGSNVGDNDELMEPVESGLGDRLAGVFDETTPSKRAETAFDAVDAMEDANADVLIGVGGGSSLDVARQASVFAADDRSLQDLREEAHDGEVEPPDPDGDRPPVIVIPTTFAGADVSSGGSLELRPAEESPTGQPVTVGGSAMPIADFADPALFETTPTSALTGSAMNGFDKGIETPYARDASPVSDATAVHGLRLLRDALPTIAGGGGGDGRDDTGDEIAAAMDRAVVGSLLVQLDRKVSIVHAFGHGFSRRYDVQQGSVHAIVVPHVLDYLFEHVDASRVLLASGLGVDPTLDADELADAVVESVAELRDTLSTPTQLRELPEPREADLPAISEFIVDDPPMARAPAELDPTAAEIEAVLREAW